MIGMDRASCGSNKEQGAYSVSPVGVVGNPEARNNKDNSMNSTARKLSHKEWL